jgi:hypothetical protein
MPFARTGQYQANRKTQTAFYDMIKPIPTARKFVPEKLPRGGEVPFTNPRFEPSCRGTLWEKINVRNFSRTFRENQVVHCTWLSHYQTASL